MRLASAWDLVPLRNGDLADSQVLTGKKDGGAQGHANTYQASSVMKLAYSEIGKGLRTARGEQGIDGCRRLQEVLLTTAAVHDRVYVGKTSEYASHIAMTRPDSLLLMRHFDSTPLYLHYGQLAPQIQRQGRYFVPDGEGRWKTVGYDNYQKAYPRRKCLAGVVEVFAQQMTVVSSTVGDDGEAHSLEEVQALFRNYKEDKRELIVPPRVITSTGSSTCFEAVNSGVGAAFSVKSMQQHAINDVKCAIIDDTPDGCPAMSRYKSATAAFLEPERNVMYDEHSHCCAHAIHNIAKAALGEGGVVGHAHAVCYVCSMDSRRRQLWGACKHLVKTELQVFPGKPPAELLEHNNTIWDRTILRTLEITRARVGSEFDAAVSQKELVEKIAPLRKYLNGDLRIPVISHYEDGCCLDEAGVICRSVQETNISACVMLLLGQLFAGEKPALNRWMSTSKMLAYILAGVMAHRLLPRLWRLAFGEPEVPVGPADSWHVYVKSKVRRVCIWFQIDSTEAEVVIFTQASGPIDHLLLELQQLDAAGGTLRQLFFDRTNPIWKCMCAFSDMVVNPAGDCKSLWFHYLPRGLEFCHQLSRALYGVILAVSAALWREVGMVYSFFPFRLVGLVIDNFGPMFERTAHELFQCNKCCVDRGMTARIICKCSNVPGLLRHPAWLSAILSWSRHRRVGNMSCERLLKQINTASRRRCSIQRLCSAGLLAQVSLRHSQAGGEDITKITRRKLLGMRVPLKARRRRLRLTRSCKRRAGFNTFMNQRQKEARELLGTKPHEALGSREEYLQRLRGIKEEWDKGSRWLQPEDDVPEPAVGYSERIGDLLFSTSTVDSPMDPKLFKATIQAIAGGPMPGLTERMKPVREAFQGKIIVDDQGAIPSRYTATRDTRCIRRHPGHCAHCETPDSQACHEALAQVVQPWPRGTLVRLRAKAADGAEIIRCRVLADNRNTSTITFAKVDQSSLDDVLQLSFVDRRGFDYEVSQSTVQGIWEVCKSTPVEFVLERMADVIDTRPKGFKSLHDAVRLLPETLAIKHPVVSSHRLWPLASAGQPATSASSAPCKERLLTEDLTFTFRLRKMWFVQVISANKKRAQIYIYIYIP